MSKSILEFRDEIIGVFAYFIALATVIGVYTTTSLSWWFLPVIFFATNFTLYSLATHANKERNP